MSINAFRHSQLIANSGHHEIDQVANRFRAVVEAGHGRQHDRTASEIRFMLSSWIVDRGVSLGTMISLRRSLRCT